MRIFAQTQKFIITRIYTHIAKFIYTHLCTRTLIYTHSLIHTCQYAHTSVHTHIYMYTRICTLKCLYMHAYRCVHTYSGIYIYVRNTYRSIHEHATHTNTYTYSHSKFTFSNINPKAIRETYCFFFPSKNNTYYLTRFFFEK